MIPIAMGFALTFVKIFALGLLLAAPILLFLMLVIAALALAVGRHEGWSRSQALYFGFITATTVGYGDLHPTGGASRALAIAIAFVGLVLTGIVVAIGLHAAGTAFEERTGVELGARTPPAQVAYLS